MHFSMYQDTTKQWRWRLVSANGRYIANSGEGYHNKADCLHAISLVQNSRAAPVREQ